MATITRRTVTELLTEHEDAMGLQGNSAYATRAKKFLDTAHRWCVAGWHHYELDSRDTALSASVGSAVVDISSLGALVITNVDLKDANDVFIESLQYSEVRGVRPLVERKNARPKRWSRWGDNLVFNCLADAAYQLDIDYYARATNLDDGASSLDLAEEWDEPVLTRSLFLAHRKLWHTDEAQSALAEFKDMVALLPNPPLAMAGLPGEPIRSTRSSVEPHGGGQG